MGYLIARKDKEKRAVLNEKYMGQIIQSWSVLCKKTSIDFFTEGVDILTK